MEKRAKTHRQVVLPVDGRDDLLSPEVRGGKGSSLAVMQRLGLPVPPAFTVSTTVMRAYLETGTLPKRLMHQLKREMGAIERKTGKKFGGRENPLLVSVRSGASVSMEGMMDTILNLGINSHVRAGFEERSDGAFCRKLSDRFMTGWIETVSKDSDSSSTLIPEDPWQQLTQALLGVIRSWENPRAQMYRNHYGICHKLGTAVNVQAMVFGNRDDTSGTGIAFSHHMPTGKPGLYGDFRANAQGEEVVSGKYTSHPIAFLRDWNHSVYKELDRIVTLLSVQERSMVEVEFTVESGVLWVLQYRRAKASLEARVTSLVHQVWEKQITHAEAIAQITNEEMQTIAVGKRFDPIAMERKLSEGSVMRGQSASLGVACGRIALSAQEAEERVRKGERVILFRPDTNPNDLPGMLVAEAIITLEGNVGCHAAVTARALNKPAVVAAIALTEFPLCSGEMVSVDGNTGVIVPGEVPVLDALPQKEVSLFVKWRHVKFPKPRFDFSWALNRTPVNRNLTHVYLLELMAFEAKGTALAFEVDCLRCAWYTKTAEFFLCYLVHAVARELRHVYHDRVSGVLGRAFEELVKCGLHRGRITDDSKEHFVLSNIGDPSALLKCAVYIFRTFHWDSCYGGERWAVIAETGLWFLKEKISHTVFVDRVFDLEHNGGRVFNKHQMMRAHNAEVEDLLNIKKRARTASELMLRWINYPNRSVGDFDSKLSELFNEGSKQHIWRK